MHFFILTIIISLFIYFVLHSVFYRKESFKGMSKKAAVENKKVTMEEINSTNDLSFGLVEFSTVPFSSASSTVKIGLEKKNNTTRPRKIYTKTNLFTTEIVGIKVPDGLSITIYEYPNFMGNYNSIIGPNTIDTLEMAKNLQYPEAEDDAGNLLENIYKGKGWQNRVKSFIIHQYREIPDEFDGVFYTQKYGINDYEKIKALGGDLSDLPEKTREAQWLHYLDFGESLGYAINQNGSSGTTSSDMPVEDETVE